MLLQNALRKIQINKNYHSFIFLCTRQYSRKYENDNSCYKPVSSKRFSNGNKLAAIDPNVEFLTSESGFPFILPGNVGIGWFNLETTLQCPVKLTMKIIPTEKELDSNMLCKVQTCPTVMRKAVNDLFAYRHLQGSELSVITLHLKPDNKLFHKDKEIETERLAQIFVITAKSICEKLRKGGYWADFINPFSGRPYLHQSKNSPLYTVDANFRCLDFQISEVDHCKVIFSKQDGSNMFIGSLFTTAPSNKFHLNTIFREKNKFSEPL